MNWHDVEELIQDYEAFVLPLGLHLRYGLKLKIGQTLAQPNVTYFLVYFGVR